MPHNSLVRRSLIAVLFVSLIACRLAFAQEATKESGRETVLRVCSTCHSANQALSQRHSREGWQRIIRDMRGRGAQGSEQDFSSILDYLSSELPEAPAPARTST